MVGQKKTRAERESDLTLPLFEKFYRLGNEIRREGRGTGLGLYIARSLIVESGGELSTHSDGPGRGALFRATWPRILQDGHPPEIKT